MPLFLRFRGSPTTSESSASASPVRITQDSEPSRIRFIAPSVTRNDSNSQLRNIGVQSPMNDGCDILLPEENVDNECNDNTATSFLQVPPSQGIDEDDSDNVNGILDSTVVPDTIHDAVGNNQVQVSDLNSSHFNLNRGTVVVNNTGISRDPIARVTGTMMNQDTAAMMTLFQQSMQSMFSEMAELRNMVQSLSSQRQSVAPPQPAAAVAAESVSHNQSQVNHSNAAATAEEDDVFVHGTDDDDGIHEHSQQGRDESNTTNSLQSDTPIGVVREYNPFCSIPVKKDLSNVPARLFADVDSATFLSCSLSKIIANLDFWDRPGHMEVRNYFDRRYCNTNSRYYVQPNALLPITFGTGQLATNPVQLSLMPNLRMFVINSSDISFTLSLYFLDSRRRLGRDATSFLTDKSLLCIVIAFNMVRLHWDTFPSIWQHFYDLNDKPRMTQIMLSIQPFFIQKPGACNDPNPVKIDLKSAAIFLLTFERCLHILAYENWYGNYKSSKYNGGFSSIKDNDFFRSEAKIREHASLLCQYSVFELSAIGIKWSLPKLQAYLPNLDDEFEFVQKHKILCRQVTDKFRNKTNYDRKEDEELLQSGFSHDLIASVDVGIELYPVVPGTNFVLNGMEAKKLFNEHLRRKLSEEKLYERTSQILRPDDELLDERLTSDDEDEGEDWNNQLGNYNETTDYLYDADCFCNVHFKDKFSEDGTPLDDSVMSADGSIIEGKEEPGFPNCDHSRVVHFGDSVVARYIPKPVKLDGYLQTLLYKPGNDSIPNLSSGEGTSNSLESDGVAPANDESEVEDSESDTDSVEETVDNIMNGVVGDNVVDVGTTNNGTVSELVVEADTENEESHNMSLEVLTDLRELTKKTRVFTQFLSNGKIANVHREQIVLELVRSRVEDPDSHLTVKLKQQSFPKVCEGGNIYMPYTRSMFTKQSSKQQQLEALFIPYLLSNLLSNVMCETSEKDYRQLQRLIVNLSRRTDELLHQLQCHDRQPIRQEITFATENFWNYKFRWPSHQMIPNHSHVGVVDSRHTYFFMKKICQDSLIPLLHITRTEKLPDVSLISPASKTCLVYLTEHILKVFQHFGYQGHISRYLKRNFKNHLEACPPPEMVVPISDLDQKNTKLKFGLKSECLPVYVLNPVKLSRAFQNGVQSRTQLYVQDLAKEIDMPHDYLLYRQSILSILQQYSKKVVGVGGNDEFVGPFIAECDESIVEESDATDYRGGFFDEVNFELLSQLPEKSLSNLFRDVATVMITGYHSFMLKRLNRNYGRCNNVTRMLSQLPKNTAELQATIEMESDSVWSEKLENSVSSSGAPNPDKQPMTTCCK